MQDQWSAGRPHGGDRNWCNGWRDCGSISHSGPVFGTFFATGSGKVSRKSVVVGCENFVRWRVGWRFVADSSLFWGGPSFGSASPTAYAVGCILMPLCGWTAGDVRPLYAFTFSMIAWPLSWVGGLGTRGPSRRTSWVRGRTSRWELVFRLLS